MGFWGPRSIFRWYFGLVVIFPLVVSADPPQAAQTSRAADILAKRKSADPIVRKAASTQSIGDALAIDFASSDPAVFQAATEALHTAMKNNGRWCQDYLHKVWLRPLLAYKRYDLIQEIVDQAFADPRGFMDVGRIEDTQAAIVEFLLAQGKNDQALAAAKTYYDFCRLEKTQEGIGLFAETLANTKWNEDKDIVQRFKQQQAAGAEMKQADPDDKIGDLGTNLLSTIKVDPSPFESKIKALETARKSYDNLTTKGNLLLMAGRAKEARDAFELAVNLASAKQAAAAYANVARAIRAQTGLVGPANAYIVALQGG
jgi:tetratricopeptide (TPR) repeat protein